MINEEDQAKRPTASLKRISLEAESSSMLERSGTLKAERHDSMKQASTDPRPARQNTRAKRARVIECA